MRFCLLALLLASSVFAGDAEKELPKPEPVQAVQLHIKGDECFATVHVDIKDLQRAYKVGTPDAKGALVKLTDVEFKQAVARRVAEQATQSYNVMLQTDVELDKRGKEAKERVDKDLEEAKKSRPRVLIED